MNTKSKSDLEKLSRDVELFSKQFTERADALIQELNRDIEDMENKADELDRDMEEIEKDGIDALDQAILGFFEECGRDLPEAGGVV
jgi:archaellum component FlaC